MVENGVKIFFFGCCYSQIQVEELTATLIFCFFSIYVINVQKTLKGYLDN